MAVNMQRCSQSVRAPWWAEDVYRTSKAWTRSSFENGKFVTRLAYLVNIFEALNQLNLKMQGQGKDIIQFVDFTNAFVEKLGNWKQKVKK